MNRRINRAYFIIPVVYAAVILLLLFLQFSGGEVFVERFGPLVLRANVVTDPRNQESSLSHVRIEYEGLAFDFDSDNPVVLEDQTGRRSYQELLSYETLENGFGLRFAEGAEVSFLLIDGQNGELHIKPSINGTAETYEAIRLPFELSGGARLETREDESMVPITYRSGRYLLTPPPRASIDPEAGLIVLPGDVPNQTVRYTSAVENRREPILTLFDDGALSVPDAAYNRLVDSYIDTGYRGWQRRFNGGSGTWLNRDGTSRFDEAILTAYLAEAWRRDEYVPAFNSMRRAADLHPQQVSLLSAPFLGGLREIRERTAQSDDEQNQRLLELVRAEDLDLFVVPAMAEFVFYRGSDELRDAVITFVSQVDPMDADLYQAIGMLKNGLFTTFPTRESADAFGRLNSVAEATLLTSLIQIEEGFLLETVSGQVDLLASFEGGIVLNALADGTDNPLYRDVGRNLVVTALSLADENGFLPRILLASGRTVQGQDGSFGLEAVYPLLTDNPAYPRIVSLRQLFGEQSWIWTIAEISEITREGETARFEVRYPRNRTHFMVFRGIPPFQSMQLFGQPWRDDPAFESYAKGRHYHAPSSTLMIKYTDDSVVRDIILEY